MGINPIADLKPSPLFNTRTNDKLNQEIVGKSSLNQQLRLISGLVLLAFVTAHLINHAAGNISVAAMNAVQEWRNFIWQSWPGSIALYGSLIVHTVLALKKIVQKNTLKMPMWEVAQIVLGLAIPWLLVTHIIAMRGSMQALDIDMNYTLALALMWPGAAISQSVLLLISWVHGVMGVHFWLRLRSAYNTRLPWFVAFYVLVPALALTGWLTGARENALALENLASQDPDTYAQIKATMGAIFQQVGPSIGMAKNGVLALGGASLALFVGLRLANRFKKHITVNYGEGGTVTTSPGKTLLEISREAGIDHMSVCGGRARCSTCRTLIIENANNISPRTEAEDKLLKKLNSDDNIRLACQAVIQGDVTVRPLIKTSANQGAPVSGDPLGWGVERQIAVFFLDIRGFSKISENSLPYDVVFILNAFFAEIANQVESNHGYVDKFMGDGMMALFGLDEDPSHAADHALRAAAGCHNATKRVSGLLTQHLKAPIRIGMGIHLGDAVIGRIGKTKDQKNQTRLTAIGDSVNVAARLEQSTKEYKAELVVSQETLKASSITSWEELGENLDIHVHNISRPIPVVAIRDWAQFEAQTQEQ